MNIQDNGRTMGLGFNIQSRPVKEKPINHFIVTREPFDPNQARTEPNSTIIIPSVGGEDSEIMVSKNGNTFRVALRFDEARNQLVCTILFAELDETTPGRADGKIYGIGFNMNERPIDENPIEAILLREVPFNGHSQTSRDQRLSIPFLNAGLDQLEFDIQRDINPYRIHLKCEPSGQAGEMRCTVTVSRAD